MGDRLVRAAGGVVWRMNAEAVEVLLVHRPALGYDDWTFPKGKCTLTDVDELHCALREVLEETGLRCAPGRELPSVSYTDAKGRPKQVRYWEMRVVSGTFVANDEVDEVRWLGLADARRSLTYPHDRIVLDAFARHAGSADPAG